MVASVKKHQENLKHHERECDALFRSCQQIYGSHSDDSTGEVLDSLPYYGEILQRHDTRIMDSSEHDPIKDAAEYWGRITNLPAHWFEPTP